MWSSPIASTGEPEVCPISVHIHRERSEYSDCEDLSDSIFEYESPKFTSQLNEQMQEALGFTINSHDIFAMQKEITPPIRFSVIDWLMKINMRLKYNMATLYNTIYLMDVYLSQRECKRDDIQLVAVTCLWMSAKVEEVKTTDLEICVAVCQKKISPEKFVKMEQEIGPVVNWRVGYPTPFTFLGAILADLGKSECFDLCLFFLDVTLYVVNFMDVPAQYRTAAAVYSGLAGSGEVVPLVRLCSLVGGLQTTALVDTAAALCEAARRMASRGFCGKWVDYSEEEKQKLISAIRLAQESCNSECRFARVSQKADA